MASPRFQAAGIDGWVAKPVKPKQLCEALLHVLAHEAISPKASSTIAAPAKPEPHSTGGLRVLLAEDNVVNQKVAVFMLQRLGCSADVAANGIEALEALTRRHYDVIFMDCQMPEMDGYEAARRIRNLDGDAAGIPIVAMTANAMQGDREECLRAGMDDYISKPVKIEDLEASLARVLKAVVN